MCVGRWVANLFASHKDPSKFEYHGELLFAHFGVSIDTSVDIQCNLKCFLIAWFECGYMRSGVFQNLMVTQNLKLISSPWKNKHFGLLVLCF